MYGYEAQTSALGGLGAQVPGGDRFFDSAARIRSGSGGIIGAPDQSGVMVPYTGLGEQVALPVMSGMGDAVEHDPSSLLPNWRHLLDFHNSPAPYILLGLLLLYAWLHVSVRAGASASGSVRGGKR